MDKAKKNHMAGINSPAVIRLSEKVRESWNDFFLESSYCQSKIRYGSEEQSNYIGDLLNYFDDTVELLAKIPLKEDYQQALYDTVSVLQLMYVGQDLIDELRTVFKMPKSSGEGKALIRNMRNELTGHPISRDNGKNFVSSVFFTRNSHGKVIEYLRYHKNTGFKADVIRYSWSNLAKTHEDYLIDNLGEIIAAIKKKLRSYQIQLEKFHASFAKMDIVGLVSRTEHLLESMFEYSTLYSKSNLLYYIHRHGLHPRYQVATERFVHDLTTALRETRESISEYRNDNVTVIGKTERTVTTKITFTGVGGQRRAKSNVKSNMRYEFSKLRERHPIFGIDYFTGHFKDDEDLVSELSHLRKVYSDDCEFYCSIEYISHMLKSRNLL
jgi:hypothetical protein